MQFHKHHINKRIKSTTPLHNPFFLKLLGEHPRNIGINPSGEYTKGRDANGGMSMRAARQTQRSKVVKFNFTKKSRVKTLSVLNNHH